MYRDSTNNSSNKCQPLSLITSVHSTGATRAAKTCVSSPVSQGGSIGFPTMLPCTRNVEARCVLQRTRLTSVCLVRNRFRIQDVSVTFVFPMVQSDRNTNPSRRRRSATAKGMNERMSFAERICIHISITFAFPPGPPMASRQIHRRGINVLL